MCVCVCVALPIALCRFSLALEVLTPFAKMWGMMGIVEGWKDLGEGGKSLGR